MSRWKGFTNGEVYLLKRAIFGSGSFEIMVGPTYSDKQKQTMSSLTKELAEEDKFRVQNEPNKDLSIANQVIIHKAVTTDGNAVKGYLQKMFGQLGIQPLYEENVWYPIKLETLTPVYINVEDL